MDIYIARGKKRKGPYSEDSIRQFLADGQFDGTELAWHEGLTEWIAVEEVGREAESAAQEQADLDRQNEEHLALCNREVDEALASLAHVKAIAAAEAKVKVAMEVAIFKLHEATAYAEVMRDRKMKTLAFKYDQEAMRLEQEKNGGLEVAELATSTHPQTRRPVVEVASLLLTNPHPLQVRVLQRLCLYRVTA